MPRKHRIHYPGATYHVMLRGNDKQAISFNNSDRKRFYELLSEYIVNNNYKIHALCFMPNHIHLAIEVSKDPLAKIMHNLTFRYTQYINKLHNRVGHLFQGRYKAILVDTDTYLIELIRYIHLNPVRANIVADPCDYEWSTHCAYLGYKKLPWLTTEIVLNRFSNDKYQAIQMYNKFINNHKTSTPNDFFQNGNMKKHEILGSKKFIQQLKETIPELEINLSLDELINYVCQYYGMNKQLLLSKNKNSKYNKIRVIIAMIAKELNIANFSETAKHFKRNPTSLFQANKIWLQDTVIGNEITNIKNFLNDSGFGA